MKSRFTGILTLFLAFMIQFSFAQEKTITGVVTSADDGLPLPGASVVVDGTTQGTQTDLDGNFTIIASQGDYLVFSFLGMSDQRVAVGASNVINVALSSDTTLIDEVVVVGYGTTTKEAYVGTAASIKTENIEAKSVSNFSQALKGEVAGVNVITSSGQPGSSATIRIRGFGSVNGNRAPLYVVDGVPFDGNISSINPADIESTVILKDATATAVYGSRGANGVILVTTKKGSSERTTIDVDLRTSVNMSLLPRHSVIKSPEQYIGLAWEGKYNEGVILGNTDPVAYANNSLFAEGGIDPAYNMWNVGNVGELIDPVTRQVRDGVERRYNPENWEDYGFQASYRQEANVRFSGGNDKTRYYSSFGYLDDEGYVVNSNYKRYSTRLNLTHNPTDWLEAGVNFGYSGARQNFNGQGEDSSSVFWFVDNIPSIYPLFARDADGNRIANPYAGILPGDYLYDYGDGDHGSRAFGGLTNSVADAHYNVDRHDRHEFNGSMNFKIKFHKNLNFETSYGAQYYDNEYNDRRNPFFGWAAGEERKGFLQKVQTRFFVQNFLQLLRYTKDFGNHGVEAFVAHESNQWEQNIFSAAKQKSALWDTFDFAQYIDNVGQPNSYTNSESLESYFGQVNYNYDRKYYLSASVRRDGASNFLPGNQWGTFWSVGGSWTLSRESFLDNVDFVNFLKVKSSYGLTGDRAGVGLWPGLDTSNITTLGGAFSVPFRNDGYPDLTWETSKIFQVGLETTLWDFLDINIDYYVKNTDDLIFQRRNAPSTGTAIITVNDGQLRNSGLEFDVQAQLIKPQSRGDFGLSFGINGEFLKNEITTMPIEPSLGVPKPIDIQGTVAWAQGGSIFDYYLREWAGVDPATGQGLWYMHFDDMNGDGMYDAGDVIITNMSQYQYDNPDAVIGKTTTSTYADATQKFVGKSAIPTVRGAFRLNATYKNFDFSSQFVYSIGGYAYDGHYAGLMHNQQAGGNNWHTDIMNRWQQPGDITNVPRISDDQDANVASASTRFLTKSDYLGLNNVRIGYTIPSEFTERMAISKVNIYLSGDNLLFWSKREGFNPSTSESGGSDMYRYSPLSTLSLGVSLQF